MKRRGNARGESSESLKTTAGRASEWEIRPGGMLVQRRTDNDGLPPEPNLRLRVAFGALCLEISVQPRATFGEVKKLLAAETRVDPADQRLMFRGKERKNGEYLDLCGVKRKSKLVLMEDPLSIERRCIDMQKNAKIHTLRRAISDVSADVDKLADQVDAIEKSVMKGKKVAEVQITTLIEMLMRQAVKLDGIHAEGDTSVQKKLQGKRVQKCVETLDVLKVKNAAMGRPVVVTTKWETFEDPSISRWNNF